MFPSCASPYNERPCTDVERQLSGDLGGSNGSIADTGCQIRGGLRLQLIRTLVRVANDLAPLGNFVFEIGGEFFGRAARNFNRCCRPSFAHITRLQALYGIAAGGQPGAELALTIFRDEISRVMALLGCNSVAELNREFLQDAEKPLLDVPPARPELRVIDGAKM